MVNAFLPFGGGIFAGWMVASHMSAGPARLEGAALSRACRKLWRRPQDGLCPTPVSHFVNLWKTEAEREQPVLLAHGPRAGKAEALAQPQHGFEPLDGP